MSWLEKARNELADAIEALPALDDVAVVRDWVPVIDREKMTGLEVHVTPVARRTRISGRNCHITAVDVMVTIMKPLEQESESEIADVCQVIGDAIIDGLLGKRIGGVTNFICMVADQIVATSETHWREDRIYSTFISTTLET